MQTRDKMLMVVLPYLIAGYLWFSLASPAFVTVQDKHSELEVKRRESTELKIKLANLTVLRQEKVNLERQIEDLRGSVPKSPDIDILMIDMERLCLASGMEIFFLAPPAQDKENMLHDATAAEALPAANVTGAAIGAARDAGTLKSGLSAAASKTELPGDKSAKGAAKSGKAAAKKGKAQPQAPVDLGLSKLVKEVTLVGAYPDLVTVMKKLEGYQRVISIDQIEFELPAEIGSKRKEEVKYPTVSFLMTAYYLP